MHHRHQLDDIHSSWYCVSGLSSLAFWVKLNKEEGNGDQFSLMCMCVQCIPIHIWGNTARHTSFNWRFEPCELARIRMEAATTVGGQSLFSYLLCQAICASHSVSPGIVHMSVVQGSIIHTFLCVVREGRADTPTLMYVFLIRGEWIAPDTPLFTRGWKCPVPDSILPSTVKHNLHTIHTQHTISTHLSPQQDSKGVYTAALFIIFPPILLPLLLLKLKCKRRMTIMS